MLNSTLHGARVVIIDDVQANMRLLESSLRTMGLGQVKGFSDSAEGLRWLQENSWDLLLLDLDMPEPDGFTILEALRERDRTAQQVILVTALGDAASRRRGLDLGGNDYVTKPVDLPELLLRVRNCLEFGHTHRALLQERNALEERVQERTVRLRDSYRAVIRALARAADYKDNETGKHIMRIGETAALIAQGLGAPATWVELLRLAAPMHDVGKIGIADQILRKPGKLSEEEFRTMQEHARIGSQILSDSGRSSLLELAAEIALNHHEKWDGTGYPSGLQGEQIPLSARIVALCDVYDALRSERPYKPGWTAERAQAFIREQSGKHFDPAVVRVMAGLFDEIELVRATLSDD
ncbi:two-component system response regulator [Pseudomonas abyssi]|jgi:putative two-component system response regulator|uniref:Two-component system response regulator n=1 Tax=Pseudomonas abyssi TaxID=170540 RepID=A0A2A3MFA4_9PSED|nr:HD domain-containing phosphohydrolase [Pseudomonas abyssi]MAD00024.1 two-component system response regulator [Pseudomonadales bacterium]PBK03234.1 two-component system response regulator [Pseudomonas abyssi]|tara:strand:+ start:26654 stop:27712 length:1059 start_codon:yes stop_codon:yes gene_type:complete